jgi:archaeal flagellar protein FlaI
MNDNLTEACNKNAHLVDYLNELNTSGHPQPEFMVQLSRSLAENKYPNLIYPVGDPIFIHICGDAKQGTVDYITIEPKLTEQKKKIS